MKKIKTILALLWFLPGILSAQFLTVSNKGAAITIKGNTAVKITGNYLNGQDGRIKNAGIVNIAGSWTKMSSTPVFTIPGGTVKFTAGSDVDEIGGNPTVFDTLVINADVNLRVNTTVSTKLTFNSGHLYLSHYDLQLLPNSTISGASPAGYIVSDDEGRLIRQVGGTLVDFPIGTSANYAPVQLTNNGTADEFSLRIFDDVLQNGTSGSTVPYIEKTVKHTWVLSDPDGSLGSPDFDMEVQWNGSMEGNNFERNYASVTQYDGSDWQKLSVTGASGPDPYFIAQPDIDALGAFSVKAFLSNYHFVKVGGAGTQDGSSWDNASPSIQDMLDIADVGDSIWVAAGTYYPETELPSWSGGTGDRSRAFQFSADTVGLIGGFAGNEDPETFDLSQRDFMTNETILSGDIGVQGDSSDNCYNIIFIYQDTSIVIDGFTVEKGYSGDFTDCGWLVSHGSGLHVWKSETQIRNMIFRNNTSACDGGAVYLGNHGYGVGYNGSISISNSVFINNKGGGGGGGISVITGDLVVNNCEFEDNSTANGNGGAIYSYISETEINNSSFTSNYSSHYGGALDIVSNNSSFTIKNSIFTNNYAYVWGGGICFDGNNQSGLLEDCSFTGNSVAYSGGALFFQYAQAKMNRLSFISNNAGGGDGGAIYCRGYLNYYFGHIDLSNSLMYNNRAGGAGGAIYIDSYYSFNVANTTFVADTANWGGALYFRYVNPRFFNTIIWNNKGLNDNHQVVLENDDTEPEFYYCDVEGGKENFGGSGAGANYAFDYDNADNMDADPLFTNPATGDYSLSGFSPCINQGTPMGTSSSPYPYIEQSGGDYILYYDGGADTLGTTDLAYDPRVYDNTIDIGSYEAQSISAGIALNLTAFLEGPFKVSDMGAELTDTPLSQPYNTAPWNYAGTESVSSIPNANVVDWVLVELRDAASASGAGSSTRLAQQAAFILKDGSIVGMDGSSVLQFNVSVTNNLYAIVWHRNHLGIMSATALTESGGIYSYNFTTSVNTAYQSGQKALNGSAVMFGGDVDGNGTVNTTDKTIWSGVAGTKGYQPSDTDMNGQVDNKDKNDIWDGNENEQTKVPN